jgi:hypothetical protein
VNERTLVRDIEHGVDAPDADAKADGGAELDDLRVAEMLSHLIDQFAADVGMGQGEPFGEFDRQTLTAAERVDVGVLIDVGVFVLGDRWLRTRRRACIQSNGTRVNLSDSHPGEFALTRGERSGVHGLGEVSGRGIQRRGQLPHAGLLGLGALGELDSRHWLTSVVG